MRPIGFGAALLTFGLAGCTALDTLNAELPNYKGQPIQKLIDKLGQPSTRPTPGQPFFAWNGQGPTPTSTCTITVSVDAANRIAGYEFDLGDTSACARFADKLRT